MLVHTGQFIYTTHNDLFNVIITCEVTNHIELDMASSDRLIY